ncbi:hypothetical protein ABE522_03860 [Stenotrophomonas pennii]|uniref:hypothetical protein n=1 Tax=Stenotrophomonas lacuserhaii TaxID=2760084 RepID=UPI0032081B0B
MLSAFAELDPREQAAFLDTLNAYLYASPQQRRRLRDAWRDAVVDCRAPAAAVPSGDDLTAPP